MIFVLLSPSNILGIFIALISWATLRRKEAAYAPAILASALILASANSTKELDGDLYNYYRISELLRELDLVSSMVLFGQEPAYYLWNWVHVSLLGLSWQSWIFSFSAIFYITYLSAVRRSVEELNLGHLTGLCLILLAAFFPLVFVQTAHLVRQYLAGAIVTIGVVNVLFGRRAVAFFLLAPLFHMSAAVFLIIPLMLALNLRSKAAIFFCGLSLPTFALLGLRLLSQSGIVANTPLPLQYGLMRLSQNEFHEISYTFGIALMFSTFMLLISLSVAFRRDDGRFAPHRQSRVTLVFTILAALSLATIFFSIVGISEIAIRFMQFLFLLMPIALGFMSLSWPLLRFGIVLLGGLMPLALLIYPKAWNYAPLGELILYPYVSFIFLEVL